MYHLPDKRLDEGNWEWCKRAAASIPPELLLRQIIAGLEWDHAHNNQRECNEAWSELGRLLGHGSGVSQAIIELYKNWGDR
jgi:hypothetical protein